MTDRQSETSMFCTVTCITVQLQHNHSVSTSAVLFEIQALCKHRMSVHSNIELPHSDDGIDNLKIKRIEYDQSFPPRSFNIQARYAYIRDFSIIRYTMNLRNSRMIIRRFDRVNQLEIHHWIEES